MTTASQKKVKHTHWNGFAASIPGGGHIRRGIPCQDASAVIISPRPAAIVCDGRGSASLSHFGAQGSVDAFRSQISILEPFLANILDAEEEKQDQWIKFCRIMYRTFMQVKYDLAEQHNVKEKEFDCTVAFAIAGRHHIGCFQVGDGSIVARQNGVCATVFIPEKGEFANQTHFLRPGGEEEMKFQHILLDAKANSGIAVTSDGPEHLMFRLSDMAPGQIFNAFLDDLRKEELHWEDLMDYLTRREWANDPRGSDDRSLAVLARIGDEAAAAPISVSEVPNKSSVPADCEEKVIFMDSEDLAEFEKEPEKKPETEQKKEQEKSSAEIPAAAAEVQDNGMPANDEAKKKMYRLWPLSVMSCLAIGLLAETVCLIKQHQTILRQQEKISCLNRQIVLKQNPEKKILQEAAENSEIPRETSARKTESDKGSDRKKENGTADNK